MFCKSIIKKPYMFRSLSYDHPQGLSFVLSAFTTFPLFASSFAFLVRGRMPSMCMCVRCTCLWAVWSRTVSYCNKTAYGDIPNCYIFRLMLSKYKPL
jgi:hypothetical protein